MRRIQQLEQRIDQIKTQLQRLGPMRPGSLSRQYNVCGKAGCRCKDPQNPQRHGPYYLNPAHLEAGKVHFDSIKRAFGLLTKFPSTSNLRLNVDGHDAFA